MFPRTLPNSTCLPAECAPSSCALHGRQREKLTGVELNLFTVCPSHVSLKGTKCHETAPPLSERDVCPDQCCAHSKLGNDVLFAMTQGAVRDVRGMLIVAYVSDRPSHSPALLQNGHAPKSDVGQPARTIFALQ